VTLAMHFPRNRFNRFTDNDDSVVAMLVVVVVNLVEREY
jgi:hypothetical protein